MMRQILLTLFLLVALLACQASAFIIEPNEVATWNGQDIVLTAATPDDTNYNDWRLPGESYWVDPYFEGEGILGVFKRSEVDGVSDPWDHTDSITVRILKADDQYIQNGGFEAKMNDNSDNLIWGNSLGLGINERYPQTLQGQVWREARAEDDGTGEPVSARWSCYLRHPEPCGTRTTGNPCEARDWRYHNGGAQDAAFKDTDVPEGSLIAMVYTRRDDSHGTNCLVPGDPNSMEGIAQFLNGVKFDPSKEIKLSAMVGKYPPAVYPWNGYSLQIVVGGVEKNEKANDGNYGTYYTITGGTLIAETRVTGSASGPDPNTFEYAEVIYTPDPANENLYGQPVQVRLCALEGTDANDLDNSVTNAVAFDDVQVTIDGQSGSGKETSGTVIFGAAVRNASNNVLEEDTVVVTVYDDACAASRGAGVLAGDINKDCVVDLLDLAELSASWLGLPVVGQVDIP